jgi:hypothetical protein
MSGALSVDSFAIWVRSRSSDRCPARADDNPHRAVPGDGDDIHFLLRASLLLPLTP